MFEKKKEVIPFSQREFLGECGIVVIPRGRKIEKVIHFPTETKSSVLEFPRPQSPRQEVADDN